MKRYFVLALTFLFLTAAAAQEYPAAEEQHAAHSIHHNHLAVFGGSTTNFYAEHTDFTLGFDYERRFEYADGLVGIGLIGDFVMAEHSEYIFFAGVFLHPGSNFKFTVGNGVAFAEHAVHSADSAGDLSGSTGSHRGASGAASVTADTEAAATETETVSNYALRFGIAYDIHIGGLSVSPTVNWDIIDGHSAAAYGIALGIGF